MFLIVLNHYASGTAELAEIELSRDNGVIGPNRLQPPSLDSERLLIRDSIA